MQWYVQHKEASVACGLELSTAAIIPPIVGAGVAGAGMGDAGTLLRCGVLWGVSLK